MKRSWLFTICICMTVFSFIFYWVTQDNEAPIKDISKEIAFDRKITISGYHKDSQLFKYFRKENSLGSVNLVTDIWEDIGQNDGVKKAIYKQVANKILLGIPQNYSVPDFLAKVREKKLRVELVSQRTRTFKITFPLPDLGKYQEIYEQIKTHFEAGDIRPIPNYIIKI